MSIIYHCDRCGTVGDAFPREITVTPRYENSVSDMEHKVVHLCGYCSSHFRVFLAGMRVDSLRSGDK